MSRFGLAFSCFFQVLFRRSLPPAAAALLPETARVPAPTAEAQAAEVERPAPAAVAPAPSPPPSPDVAELRNEGVLLLLSLFQREGRLLDFLRESIDAHADSDIGAAARAVHAGCRKVLDEHVKLTPVMPGDEEGPVTVPRGFDPSEVQLVGTTGSTPPFRGTLLHHGWRAVEVRFPSLSAGIDRHVLAPAEVRVP
jgi:uncharacterized protein DUF2760